MLGRDIEPGVRCDRETPELFGQDEWELPRCSPRGATAVVHRASARSVKVHLWIDGESEVGGIVVVKAIFDAGVRIADAVRVPGLSVASVVNFGTPGDYKRHLVF